MRILVINPILYTSETAEIKKVQTIKDTMICNMCLEFKKSGYEPTLIAASDYIPNKVETYDFEVIFLKTICKKIFKPNCFPLLEDLGRYLKVNSDKFDFIISSEVFSMSSLYVSTHLKNKTLIWHELAKHNNILKKIPSKIWYNIVARVFFKNTRIIPRSKNAHDFISDYCNNVSTEYIDHGVDLDRFEFCSKKEKKFIVLSQLIPRKRIDGIIVIFQKFIELVDKEYKLLIVGKGEEENKLKKLVSQLNLNNNVEFKGFMHHKEVIPMIATSKAMIINTEKDNNMVSIVESIATGTPILTTNVPYNIDYIKRYNLGIVKEKLNYSDLEKIISNNEIYVKNCKDYRNRISNKYHVNQFVNEYRILEDKLF